MAIDFPDTPAINDTHTVGNITWTWDGTAWSVLSSTGGGGAVTNKFITFAGDTGSTTANLPTDTLTIAGGTDITTSVTGDTLTVDYSGSGGGGGGGSYSDADAIAAITGSNLDMGSNDITTTGKIKFANVYDNLVDLPSATTYHGMFAHVHATGAAYFAHAGAWVRLANHEDLGGGGGSQNLFGNIAVDGQSTVSADNTNDTLTFIAGSNITLTTNATNDSITINSTASGGGGSSTFSGTTDATAAGLNVAEIYMPAIVMLTVTNNSASSYRFTSHYGATDNPTIYAISGTTIAFNLQGVSSSHPFQIQDTGGSSYDTGLVHVTTTGTVTTGSSANARTGGVLYWQIPQGISGNYQYQCTSHGPMNGTINIKQISTI
tara:strand:- start:4922 stop:6052 length:1131 start_codon:yes stop_codon:yes gene_type:complete